MLENIFKTLPKNKKNVNVSFSIGCTGNNGTNTNRYVQAQAGTFNQGRWE
jgi:hypothetical protein